MATYSTSSGNPFAAMRIPTSPVAVSDEDVRQWREERAAERRALRIARSGIPPRFRADGIAADMAAPVREWTRDVLAGRPRNLVLQGRAGCGKTHQACAALLECANARPVAFATFGDVLRSVRATYGGAGSEGGALGAYRDASVLCVDDIGKERPTADALEKLFALVDYRYSRLKATIYTTQYDQPSLGRRLMAEGGDYEQASAIIRRVYEGASVVDVEKLKGVTR